MLAGIVLIYNLIKNTYLDINEKLKTKKNYERYLYKIMRS